MRDHFKTSPGLRLKAKTSKENSLPPDVPAPEPQFNNLPSQCQ